ncbi:hypothetical protein AK95_14920 [Paenibacillus sp. LC231]|uniref:DUF5957 family protein n=1 Tax=unclassified Paenibacillus TaxID=185978 RepID=UPI0008DDEF68|nr:MULTISPECIES: DUF5957 family protein [unclassified Paenibacillus]MCT1401697.1 DUF5957 family protein [Paenibacillus sp. p3-SID867]OIB04900.1 hypothetical protein AK95_14920 [Paenibacillus sp. LC231]
MRSLAAVVMALIGGFAGGVVLNAAIAVMSHIIYGGDESGLKGLKYLPFVTSAWYAATLMIWRRPEYKP